MIVLEIRKERHYRARNLDGLLDSMRRARVLQRSKKLETERVEVRRDKSLSVDFSSHTHA